MRLGIVAPVPLHTVGATTRTANFACDCGYVPQQRHDALIRRYEEIGRMLSAMIEYPQRFAPK